MAAVYSQFLQSPGTSHLAEDASLNYITTTTVITEPNAILKHLQTQQKQVTKKGERVLHAIEESGSLFLETETTLQFNNGGGAYLPSVDDNLLDEKLVTFPMLHVISFDADEKIKQIRLHWDQGTLLKQVEAIGKTGRNWPIRDGKAQIEAISKSVKSSGIQPNPKQPLNTRDPNEVVIREHRKHDSVSATRDPHASLALFAARDINEAAPGDYSGLKHHVPRGSAKPAPRDYNELFASGDSEPYEPTSKHHVPRASAKPAPRDYNELFASGDSQPPEPGSKARSPSPSKVDGVILKSGAGKHYTGNRLFDENEDAGAPRSPERKKVFNQKYQHFAFGDGEDVPRPTSNGKSSKAGPTFSFEDFSTPPKYMRKARPDDELHWGADDPPSPPKRPVVHAPRKDADAHFQFTDQDSPATQRPVSQRQNGMNLYGDPNAYEEEPVKKPFRDTMTNVDNARRGDDFGAHYKMTDSPAQNENVAPNKRATRSDMDQHWAFSDPQEEKKIYKTAGDGMGSRKGGFEWARPEEDKKIYKTAGDGAGGRAATARSWGIGDDSDPEYQADVRASARRRRGQQQQAQAGAADF